MEKLRFLSGEQVRAVRDRFGTPTYVYDEGTLAASAEAALAFPNAFGLTVRYAMKACPTAAVLRLFTGMGLHIDASSGHEVHRAVRAGIAPERISLSTQELPEDFGELREAGTTVNLCSLQQLRRYGERFPGGEVGLRFNPGLGSGGTVKTNVGGPASSFGIWHEAADEALRLVEACGLRVFRIHSHIGSGGDPEVWQRVALLNLDLVRRFPEATVLNLGGGYKVGRMAGEPTTDLQVVGAPVKAAFEAFAAETGRRLHLEIEPGTILVANACALVATVQDETETGAEGFRFLKLDSGMTELLRPSLYGAQHPMVIVPADPAAAGGDGDPAGETEDYVIVGHCCESGDLLTPAAGESDRLEPRRLRRAAVGDLCVIGGVGAYCASMPAKNYNSFPEAAEVMVGRETGELRLVRRRQTLDQIIQNEVAEPGRSGGRGDPGDPRAEPAAAVAGEAER